MTAVSTLAVVLVIGTLGIGCKDKASGGGAASAAGPSPSAPTAAAAAPSLPAKGPWETIKITAIDKKDADGSPYFKVENLGAKTVNVIFIDFYGYDAKGKQVAHQERSFNIPLKGGASAETYTSPKKEVATWEATYHGVEIDGDKLATDNKRAPATRPKGG